MAGNIFSRSATKGTTMPPDDGPKIDDADDPRVMIIGRIGAGKSTLANKMAGTEGKFEVSDKMLRENAPDPTPHYGAWMGEWRKGYLWLIDTPGYDDVSGNDEEHRKKAEELLKKLMVLHVFVLVIKVGERFSGSDKKSLETIVDRFDGGGKQVSQRLVIVLSHYRCSSKAETKRMQEKKPRREAVLSSTREAVSCLLGIDCASVPIMVVDAKYRSDRNHEEEALLFNRGMEDLWYKIREIAGMQGLCPANGFQLQLTKNGPRQLAIRKAGRAIQSFNKAAQDLSLTLEQLKVLADENRFHHGGNKGARLALAALGNVAGGLGVGGIFFPPMFLAAAAVGGVAALGNSIRSLASGAKEARLEERRQGTASQGDEAWEELRTNIQALRDLDEVPELKAVMADFEAKMLFLNRKARTITRQQKLEGGPEVPNVLEHAAETLKVGAMLGGAFTFLDDIAAAGVRVAAGGAVRVAGPVLGGIGAGLAVLDMGFAINDFLKKNPTVEDLETLIGLIKQQQMLCQETAEKTSKIHWNIFNNESVTRCPA